MEIQPTESGEQESAEELAALLTGLPLPGQSCYP